MKLLITGGTGFIGSALCRHLVANRHDVTVLSRKPEAVAKLCGPTVRAIGDIKELHAQDDWQAIINLAGAPIFASRWTQERKQLIRASRIKLTEALVSYMAAMANKPAVFISGSAIGYYGDQGDQTLTEQAPAGTDFSGQLCQDWEQAAQAAEQWGVRVCLMRTGLVIGQGGGLLQKMLLPFQLGLGGRIGNGRQWMSWIHRNDWIAIAETMLANPAMQGPYNATAPHPVTNAEFAQTLAACLNRPALLPAPAGVLKALLGEMSELVLGSQRVLPERLLAQGFNFQHPELAAAIRASL